MYFFVSGISRIQLFMSGQYASNPSKLFDLFNIFSFIMFEQSEPNWVAEEVVQSMLNLC